MKIKLHNSLGKKQEWGWFLFDEKIMINFSVDLLILRCKIDDRYPFISFSTRTKKFEEHIGFGKNDNIRNQRWWKTTSNKWEEMSK